MSHLAPASSARCRRTPRGLALVVVLVFLAAAALLVVSALQNAALAERGAAAASDHLLARQAAEAALRDAALDLDGLRVDGTPCVGGPTSCRPTGERPLEERRGGPGAAVADAQCTAGHCLYAYTAAEAPWRRFLAASCDAAATVPYGRYTGAAPLAGVAAAPCYLIEIERAPGATADGRYLIRITARGTGRAAGSVVILQRTLSRENS